MWAMSESEISVPIDISAAALRTASRSSGRSSAKDVVAAFVRKPVGAELKHRAFKATKARTHFSHTFRVSDVVDDYFGHFWEMPAIPFLAKVNKFNKTIGAMRARCSYLDAHRIYVDFLV
jgi:hypothetical protein